MWELLSDLNNLTTPDHRATINRKLLCLNLTDEGDMTEHLNSFMELVAEADPAGLPWGQNDREKCNRFIDTLPHSLKCVRLEWRTLDKPDQTFLAFVRLYNEENAERKSSAQRSVDAMAMSAIRTPLKIKGAAKIARGV
ncbi:hypothetical protein A4X13_0g8654 [Tilletia indica]|uniref:Uncharacterized protein n=1 Tax=Tilletia indica TaxID=43049 RepID=A0A8T8SDT9_9BASI|nr:hypothetical protein A4X13_0g8654 [Tilletia indica]